MRRAWRGASRRSTSAIAPEAAFASNAGVMRPFGPWHPPSSRARDEEGEGRRERAAFAPRPARRRPREPPHPRRRPDADAEPRVPADRAAARDGPVLAVPDRGGLGLRRARAGLVLEQLLVRRAHRHALRRADPLDLGQGPRQQLGRHDPGRALRRAGVRDRLQRAGEGRRRLPDDRRRHRALRVGARPHRRRRRGC